MNQWLEEIPQIDLALGAAVLVALLLSIIAGRRGGQYRGLPGWAGFWVVFAAVLLCLSRVNQWVSFALLALLMFATLRAYFFVAPVRPRDRYVILAAYASIPLALWPAFIGSSATFLATVPVSLLLFIPVFLSFGYSQDGLLDSTGRTLLGVIFFVYCIAHLGLLVHDPRPGLPQLFGALVLAGDLPQRLAGRFSPGSGWVRPTAGVVAGLLFAVALGFWLGPLCGIVEEDGGRAGFLVALAATLGALVSEAVARDLDLKSASMHFGRGAFLNRTVPAVYAAPVFFHYLDHFA